LLHEVHESLNYLLLVLLAGHVAAAFKHHWLDRDDIFKRMLPFGSATSKDNA